MKAQGAEGLPLNCTHETLLRFLAACAAAGKDVDAAGKILAKIFRTM